MKKQILAALWLASAVVPGYSAVVASSAFDSGADGWAVSDMFAGGSPAAATHSVSGGNPGGFIRTTDIFTWVGFQAPASFLGNQGGAYGGSLQYDLRIAASGTFTGDPLLAITDGTTILAYTSTTNLAAGVFSTLNVPLTISANWKVANTVGPLTTDATEAQLRQVLGNLTALRLNADWISGADQSDIDNVILTAPDVTSGSPVPEPSTYGMAAVAMAALAWAKQRRG